MNYIYCRQSVDKKDSISIETQIEKCKLLVPDGEEYEVYFDKGYSGKNLNRPEFQKMLNNIKLGKANKLITYKLDRVSRSVLDFNSLQVILQKYNVEFVSCTENLDTSTPMGKAMGNIISTFAQLEREQIAMRVKDNYYSRGSRGYFLGGTVPYGFTNTKIVVDGKNVAILEVEHKSIEVIKEMFELYANTEMSLGKISDYFNEKNITSATGKRWDSGKISRILKSPLYVKADVNIYYYYKGKGCNITNSVEEFTGENACFIIGKREANERRYTNVENHTLSLALHNGIINSDVFLKCQRKLDSNKQICRSGSGKHTWLTGLLKCGYCSYALSVVTNSIDRKYLNCRGKTNLKVCNGHSKPLKLEDIEKIVSIYINERIKNIKNKDIEISKNDSAELNKLYIEIAKIDSEIEKLVEKILLANDVVMNYINEKIATLDKKKNKLYSEVAKIDSKSKDNIGVQGVLKDVEDFNLLDFDSKKFFAKTLINKIFITDDEIKIDWVN